MPRYEDANIITNYEESLYSMSDESFIEYATGQDLNTLFEKLSEADKTAFLIRSMMLGTNPDSFYNDLHYKRINMYEDGPEKVREIIDNNRENPKPYREIQYEVYRAILYSDQNDIRNLATRTVQKMSAKDIFEQHNKLNDIFTNHLKVSTDMDVSPELQEEMISSAKQEQANFMKELGPVEEEIEIGAEEEHVYVPLKDRPQVFNINEVGDYVEQNEFTVADNAGDYSIVIKPVGEGKTAENLLDGYDPENTSKADKRNMLFSYTLQGMGRFEITGLIQKVQANEPMRNLFDLCILAMSSKEIIENKELIKKAVLSGDTRSQDAFRLNQKVNTICRNKGIQNPFIKAYEGNILDDEEYEDKKEENNILIGDHENNINIIQNDELGFLDNDFNIELNFHRPELENHDLRDEVKNANVWIDEIKAEYDGDPYKADKAAARILAARILVDSERGVLKSLKKPVNGRDIDALADKLAENETFKKFMDQLEVDEKRNLLTHSGHGGVFEDKFKEFILKQKAGELHNDRILDRFMPKVYQRIEELQRQAKEKSPSDPIKSEVAEVMLLRAMIGARRNQPDKLSAKIPTFSNLPDEVTDLGTMMQHPDFVGACDTQTVRSDFQKGHGGLMIENMFKSPDNSKLKNARTQDFKTYCTAKYRYEKLQERAKTALDNLKNRFEADNRSQATKDCCMEAKEVIAEAVVMAMAMSRDDHPNKEISPTLQSIQIGTDIIKKDETFNDELFPKRNAGEFYKELKTFAEAKNPQAYAEEMLGKLRTVYMQKHPEAANKVNKNQKIVENPQAGKGKGMGPGPGPM